ncbi:MAG: ral secretion pathway protein [Blastocatellia bacterium]|nr:ral secretion pathway protein [Blastocatellia bacterium]
MNYKSESRWQKAESRKRKASLILPPASCPLPSDVRGFSLIELVITITVLAILTLGTIPLVQVAVKRQKEQELREALRTMREAIDQFHREALAGAQAQANQQQPVAGQNPQPNQQPNQPPNPGNIFSDPRVRVYITDQTIFTAENIDRYPPDLDTLVKGVSVLPITTGALNRRGNANVTALDAATEESTIPKTKIYLRGIPRDPMTGEKDWDFRSCYDTADSTSWGGENVFDVHSKSKGTSLNGEKYSDW